MINCGLASILSGLTYALFPRYEIFTAGISNAITMIYKNIERRQFVDKKIELPKVMKIINNLPIYYLLMIASVSILTQLRVFHPYHVNKVVDNFIAIGSNGKHEVIIERIIGVMMGYGID